jgi:hypothetical protein
MLVVSGMASAKALHECCSLSQCEAEAFGGQRIEASGCVSNKQDVGADPSPDVLPQWSCAAIAARRLGRRHPLTQSRKVGKSRIEVAAPSADQCDPDQIIRDWRNIGL